MGAGEGVALLSPASSPLLLLAAPQAMREKRAQAQPPPVSVAVRTAPSKRAIAPKPDSQARASSNPPPRDDNKTASAPPPMTASAPPPREQGPAAPAGGPPLITTTLSSLPEAIQDQLKQLGVTLQSSPRKDCNRPVGKPPPPPQRVLRGRQVTRGGTRRRGALSTSKGRMQPMVGGQAATGGISPKQVQERQQMLEVLTGSGLEVSDS